jgi:hypothetical protein
MALVESIPAYWPYCFFSFRLPSQSDQPQGYRTSDALQDYMETVLGKADGILKGVDGVNGLLDTAQEVLDVDVNITDISNGITVSLLLTLVVSHPAILTCSPQLALSLPNLAVKLEPHHPSIHPSLPNCFPTHLAEALSQWGKNQPPMVIRNSIGRTAWRGVVMWAVMCETDRPSSQHDIREPVLGCAEWWRTVLLNPSF